MKILLLLTLKQYHDIEIAIFYISLSTIWTRAFIPEQFAVYVEICGWFDFLKIHLKLIPPTLEYLIIVGSGITVLGGKFE